jgi:hypothetical protein
MNIKIKFKMHITIFFFYILSSNLYAEEKRFAFYLPEVEKNDTIIDFEKKTIIYNYKKDGYLIKNNSFFYKLYHKNKFNKNGFFLEKINESKKVLKLFIDLEAEKEYFIDSKNITEINFVKIIKFLNLNLHTRNYIKAEKKQNYFTLTPVKSGLFYMVINGNIKNFNIYSYTNNNFTLLNLRSSKNVEILLIKKNCFEKEGIFYNYIIYSVKLNEIECIKTTKFLLDEIITTPHDYEIYHKLFSIKKL